MSGDQRKERLMALIGKGEEFRNAGSPPLKPAKAPATSKPVPAVEALPPPVAASDEPPPERPEILSFPDARPSAFHIRERRKGMRSDPSWQQKTIYLKRANIDRAEEIARLMGIDFSVLVDYALALQVQAETRSVEIQKILDQRKKMDSF